jgi:hypothetical protein
MLGNVDKILGSGEFFLGNGEEMLGKKENKSLLEPFQRQKTQKHPIKLQNIHFMGAKGTYRKIVIFDYNQELCS